MLLFVKILAQPGQRIYLGTVRGLNAHGAVEHTAYLQVAVSYFSIVNLQEMQQMF
jgi:hypothetical protein